MVLPTFSARRKVPTILIPSCLQTYFTWKDGDVIRLNPASGAIRVLYRIDANANSILVTERCNSFCLMCSQPPRNIDDSYLIAETVELIKLIDRSTSEIGITGGEPTLLGEGLLKIIKASKSYLPETALHILSNGKTFQDQSYTAQLAAINHHDMMIGIPLYSDIPSIHDYVVQSENAFHQTIRGILNLKRHQQKVEIRIVIHKQTYERLPELCRFIGRNLQFVDHVALMGLEMMGFAKANKDLLWLSPLDYSHQLEEAVDILELYKINHSIYNHPLCLTPETVWDKCVKSISDWKNDYTDECGRCLVREQCGGLFSSSTNTNHKIINAITEAK